MSPATRGAALPASPLIRLAADEAELLTIAVDPKWRGKRIGQALLHAVFDDLLMSPARRMFLEVSEENTAGHQALWSRRLCDHIEPPQRLLSQARRQSATALVMARDLG
jgi:ribosomal-protein-alanine N-acetyltransferase